MMLKNFGSDLKGADDVPCSTMGQGVMCKRLVLREPDCPDGWTGFRGLKIKDSKTVSFDPTS